MNLGRSLRGQPLAMFLIVIVAWSALRMMTWQSPEWLHFGQEQPVISALAVQEAEALPPADFAPVAWSPPALSYPAADPRIPYWWIIPQNANRYGFSGPLPSGRSRPIYVAQAPAEQRQGMGSMTMGDRSPIFTGPPGQGDAAWGRDELADASLAQAAPPIPMSPGRSSTGADRWSADAWVLARREGQVGSAAARPRYGASQAGAVLRYHLAPGHARKPTAYIRLSRALGAVRESEIASGLAARPLRNIPVMLAAEARGLRSGGKTHFRPAVLAYTQLPPFDLPKSFRGEAYLQAGYVGGKFSTGFIDGQLRASRPAVSVAGTTLHLGAGLWGGAQKGASRLDAGPSAVADVALGGIPSRVSMDWRFRLLGDAEPDSGPAVTISAGF